MGREDHPSGGQDNGGDGELPDVDMRVVTLLVDVSGDESGDVQVDFAGAGYYEAIGMLATALFQTLMAPFAEEMFGSE